MLPAAVGAEAAGVAVVVEPDALVADAGAESVLGRFRGVLVGALRVSGAGPVTRRSRRGGSGTQAETAGQATMEQGESPRGELTSARQTPCCVPESEID